MQVPLGTDEYKKIGRDLVWISLNNLWNIGAIGQIPKPVIIKTNLGNTPGEEATYSLGLPVLDALPGGPVVLQEVR